MCGRLDARSLISILQSYLRLPPGVVQGRMILSIFLLASGFVHAILLSMVHLRTAICIAGSKSLLHAAVKNKLTSSDCAP